MAAGGATYGYLANPTDANGDGVIDDKDRGLNAMVVCQRRPPCSRRPQGGWRCWQCAERRRCASCSRTAGLSKANRVYAPGKPDDLGFITRRIRSRQSAGKIP